MRYCERTGCQNNGAADLLCGAGASRLCSRIDPSYSLRMATQLRDDMDYLTDAEGLLQSLRALVPHAVALVWTTRALEKDAKVINVLSRTVCDNRVAARLEGLSNRALDVADHLKSSGFLLRWHAGPC